MKSILILNLVTSNEFWTFWTWLIDFLTIMSTKQHEVSSKSSSTLAWIRLWYCGQMILIEFGPMLGPTWTRPTDVFHLKIRQCLKTYFLRQNVSRYLMTMCRWHKVDSSQSWCLAQTKVNDVKIHPVIYFPQNPLDKVKRILFYTNFIFELTTLNRTHYFSRWNSSFHCARYIWYSWRRLF